MMIAGVTSPLKKTTSTARVAATNGTTIGNPASKSRSMMPRIMEAMPVILQTPLQHRGPL